LPKLAYAILLIAIMISGLAFVSSIHFVTAQAYTQVNGVITSDTTWTKSNSPYSLTGPVKVNNGVVLTIEAGVTVNLNSYYVQVYGTLVAQGTSNEKIQINGVNGSPSMIPLGSSLAIASSPAGITFNDYNRTGSGSIIENAIINSTTIALGSSDKINNCTIIGSVDTGQSSIISNNTIKGQIDAGGTSQILSNNISGEIQVEGGSPVVSNNVVSNSGGSGITFELTDNILIYGNIIINCGFGITAVGYATIENNLIMNNDCGISFSYRVTIENNTIAKNQIGLKQVTALMPAIVYNNLQNNSYNYYVGGQGFDANATYNWWGTTNPQAINQTIYDSKNDFNLGTVNFEPFLTSPNAQAPDPNMQIPNSTPLPSPTSTPITPEFPSVIIVTIVMAMGLMLSIFKRRKKHFNAQDSVRLRYMEHFAVKASLDNAQLVVHLTTNEILILNQRVCTVLEILFGDTFLHLIHSKLGKVLLPLDRFCDRKPQLFLFC
jgi:hypothetical protein